MAKIIKKNNTSPPLGGFSWNYWRINLIHYNSIEVDDYQRCAAK
jgi:hypothetical protein